MSREKKKARLGAVRDRQSREQVPIVPADLESWSSNAIALAIFSFISLLAFANSLHNDFVRDDLALIVANRGVQSWKELPNLFVTDYWASAERIFDQLYRPLAMVSYLVNYAFGGTNPVSYHVVNLTLHILVVFGVYQLGLRLRLGWGAAVFGAVLFAVHPIHTEVVDPVTGRADLLSTLGVLLALNWYIDLDRPTGRRLRWLALSWGAFAAALLAKESAVVLPGLLVLYEIYVWNRKSDWRSLATRKGVPLLGYLLILVAYMIVRWAVMGTVVRAGEHIAFLDNPIAGADWYLRSLNAWLVAGKYLLLFVWPMQLSVDYSYNAIPLATSLWDVRVLASLVVWFGLLGLAVRSYFRGTRVVFFAIGYFVVSFLPVSNWLVPIGTIMGERLLYLPSVGLCLLVGYGWHWLFVHFDLRVSGLPAKALYAAATVIVLLLTVRTVVRNRDWSSNPGQWEVAAQTVPNSAKVHYVVAVFALAERRIPKAVKSLDRAVEIYPDYPKIDAEVARAYGAALLMSERVEEAIPYLEMAVAVRPEWADAALNLGLSYALQESWEKAEAAFRKALALDINKLKAHKGLMISLRKQGRYLEAIEAADRALSVKEDFIDARFNRAAALEALGRMQEAQQELVAMQKAQARSRVAGGEQEGTP